MQGKPKVIAILNEALQQELTAITQYFLHAEMCGNWHYDKLDGYIKKLSIVEMKHAEALIEHILFLDGTPNLTELLKLSVGQNVKEQIESDLKLEMEAVTLYNRASSFPGKDSVMRMVEVNDEMTGMEMEPKKDTAAALDDWFFDKYGFEDYWLPKGFGDYETAGARLFKQDDEPVAQVAIPDHNMVFFSFKAEDFGVNLPNDKWHTFNDGEWVAAVRQHDEECFMVTFRGSAGDMKDFLKGKE